MTAHVLVTPPAAEPLSVAQCMTHGWIDGSNLEPAPGVFAVALASPAAAGSVNAGAHRYLATFTTADGETQAGEMSAPVTVADAAVNGQVVLTGIPVGGSAVTARKLYRTVANGTHFLLLATIADNTTATYTDNIADAALGAEAPAANTTQDWMLALFIRSARSAAERITRRALVTQTWDLMLDHFPSWHMVIPRPKTQSIVSITYVDTNGNTQTMDPATYHVDLASEPARITPAFGLIWPIARWQDNAVTVRFIAGYGTAADVPSGIKSWMLMRIKTLWDNRSSIEVGQRVTMIELPSEFVDGLLDDFTVTSFDWAWQP